MNIDYSILKTTNAHNIIMQLHDGISKEIFCDWKFENIQLLVENFTIYSLSALHKRGILELKEN